MTDENRHLTCVEAEEFVLGSILQGADVGKVLFLEAQDFAKHQHQRIFSAMRKLYDRGDGVDPIAVVEVLRARQDGCAPEEVAYCSGLPDKAPTPSLLVQHARVVKKVSDRRRLMLDLTELVGRLEVGADPREVVDECAALRCFNQTEGPDVYSMREALTIAVDEIEKIKTQEKVGTVPTGFKSLEKYAPRPGNVVIIGAHPSVGKSELAIEIGINIGKLGIPSLFVSSEMTLEDSLWRVLSRESLVTADRFRCSEPFTRDEMEHYGTAIETSSHLPMSWSLLSDVNRIGALIRSLARQGKIKVAFVDYLQLLNMPEGDNRNLQVQEASRMFKHIGKETGCVIYLLSQVNRKTDRASGPPTMRDLRDSGAIEQDADEVWMLDRQPHGRELKCEIAKNRNGPTGSAQFSFFKGHIFDDQGGEA
jgi:replicative DNA helicase